MSDRNPLVDKAFSGQAIKLDGKHFQRCRFHNCQIIFAASETFALDGCEFEGCTWLLDGAAELTLQFLTAIYGIRPDGKMMVEQTFTNIRAGKHPQSPPLPPISL